MNKEVDFAQMPWSPAPASWRYENLGAWKALEAAVREARSLTLAFPASCNPHLAGVLTLKGASFTASVAIQSDALPPEGAITRVLQDSRLLNGFVVEHKGSTNGIVTVTLRADLPDKAEQRLKSLLVQLWDFQLLVVRIFSEAYGIRQTPPDKKVQPSLVQTFVRGEAAT